MSPRCVHLIYITKLKVTNIIFNIKHTLRTKKEKESKIIIVCPPHPTLQKSICVCMCGVTNTVTHACTHTHTHTNTHTHACMHTDRHTHTHTHTQYTLIYLA